MWTNNESYAVEDGLEGLTERESKLDSYWNTPFKKICLGMAVNGDRKWMMLDYEASSLYSVIADGKYRSTSAGRATWLSLIANSSMLAHCNYEGFNINLRVARKELWHMHVRLGLVANDEDDCESTDSWIGFGVEYIGCVESHQACGNRIHCSDNVDIPAFGYIFVQ